MMAVTGRFDALAVEHGVHALDTIGDAYLAATNLNGDQVDSPPLPEEFLHHDLRRPVRAAVQVGCCGQLVGFKDLTTCQGADICT